MLEVAQRSEDCEARSLGGKVTMPLGNAPWGPYFGRCVDRSGVQRMVSLPKSV